MENPVPFDVQSEALERVRAHARQLFPLCLQLRPMKPDKIKTPESRAALLAFKAAASFEFWMGRFELEESKAEAAPEGEPQAPGAAGGY